MKERMPEPGLQLESESLSSDRCKGELLRLDRDVYAGLKKEFCPATL
jgi:hypothetical protein